MTLRHCRAFQIVSLVLDLCAFKSQKPRPILGCRRDLSGKSAAAQLCTGENFSRQSGRVGARVGAHGGAWGRVARGPRASGSAVPCFPEAALPRLVPAEASVPRRAQVARPGVACEPVCVHVERWPFIRGPLSFLLFMLFC